MKKITFMIFMSLFGVIITQAKTDETTTWEKPTLQGTTFADGDTVYFYNVASGKFLTEGNAYNTEASLGKTGTMFAPLLNDSSKMYTMFNKAAFSNGKKNAAGWSKMFADSYSQYPGAAYLDEGNQGHDQWVFFKNEDGTLEISLDTTLTSDIAPTRLGWDGGDNTVVYPILNMGSDNEAKSNYGIKWKVIKYNDPNYTYYAKKSELSNAMTLAQSYNVDFTDALAVYNNASATEDELTAAKNSLVYSIHSNALTGASDSDPKSATKFIDNYDCTSLDGWSYKLGVSNSWQVQPATYTNGNVTINNFIERWIAGPSVLPNQQLYQTLTNMPNGAYQLTADVNATQQSNDNDQQTGTFLFAKSGSTTDSVQVSTKGGQPEEYTLDITVTDGTLTIGYETVNTTCNWVCVDNFSLIYYGNGTGLVRKQLLSSITDASNYAANNSDNMKESIYTSLTEAIDNAQSVYDDPGSESDNITSQMDSVNAALKVAKENVTAYASLKVALDSATNVLQKFDATKYDIATLEQFLDEGLFDEHYANHDYTTKECNDNEKVILNAVKKAIYSGIKAGNDITFIIQNPNFESATGWNGTKTVNTDLKLSEAYETTFDTYQIFTNVPNGQYKFIVQAFQRTAGNAAAYTQYKEKTAVVNTYMYANEVQKKVNNVFDCAQPTALFTSTDWMTDYPNSDGTYTPNSVKGARAFFDANLYNDTVQVVVVDSTLRIGVALTDKTPYSTGYWSLFTNFRLFYEGATVDKDIANALVAKGEALYNTPMNADSLSALKSLVDATKVAEGDALLKDFAALNKAINAANNSINAYSALTKYMAYSKQITDSLKRTAGAADYATAYAAIESNISAGNYKDSDIPAAIINAKTATNKYLMSDVNNASASNAVDVSFVIQNANFDKNIDEWALVSKQHNVTYNCFEVFNSDFNLSQTLYGMPQGTYRLETQGYYRDGSNANLADSVTNNHYGINSKLFINDATGDFMPITDGAADSTGTKSPKDVYAYGDLLFIPNSMQTAAFWFDSLAVGKKYLPNDKYNFVETEVKSDADGVITIGAKKTYTVGDDWTILSGFKLYYLGISSGINSMANDNSKTISSKYYGINGAQYNKPIKGINIVKSTMSDGTVKVQKIIVK
jgi:hypothetical protein